MIDKTISHYKILEKLGEGGMGVVYKAEDTKLRRTVALKILPLDLTRDPAARKRFLHEARIASSLENSHICTIHEIDETEEGQVFMVMPCYDGKILKDRIEKGPLDIAESIQIIKQVIQGLSAAHEKGVIHRDIKPANVFITRDGTVKILDFGLAKLAGQTVLTKEGSTLGTVAYMSPEQAQGNKVDEKSDIWSLGVVLYEMITGQRPFRGDYDQAVMYAIMNENPEPVTGLRTGVPVELEKILFKCFEKDPSDRYQQVNELLVDLRRLIKSGLNRSGSVKTNGKSKKSVKHLILLVPAVFLSLVVLVAVSYFFILRKTSSLSTQQFTEWKNSIAVLPFTNISADKEQDYFCDGMTEEIITKLTYINALKVISRTSAMKYKNTKKTIKEIGKDLTVKNVLAGSVRRDKNRVRITAQLIRVSDDAHLWAKNYDRNLEDIFTIQDEVSKAIANVLQTTLSPEALDSFKSGRTTNMQAYEYYLKGMFLTNSRYLSTLAEEDFQQAVKMMEKAVSLDPTFVKGYVGLVWLHVSHLLYTRNQADLMEIQKFSTKLEEIAPESAQGQFSLGLFYTLKKDFDRAFDHFKKAWVKSSNDANISYSIGFFYYQLGLYRKALKFCDRAIALDPFLSHSYVTPILCSTYIKEYRRAESYFGKVSELHKDHPVLLQFMCRLYLRIGNYEKAEEIFEKLREVQNTPEDIYPLHAILYALKGDRDKALELDQTSSQVFAILDLKDRTIEIMQKSLESNEDAFDYLYLINQPFYDNLRDDSRFQKIVADAKEIYEERLKKYGDL
jgi:serine/threonine protein kinase/Tfp pilus assembly protein PilF